MDVDEVRNSFNRGVEALKVAEELMELNLPAAANRAYIAGENLAYALLTKMHGSSSRNHSRLWKGVHELYEKGILSMDYRPVLESSYRLRIKGDYGRDVSGAGVALTKSIVEKQINDMKEFLNEIKKILKENKK